VGTLRLRRAWGDYFRGSLIISCVRRMSEAGPSIEGGAAEEIGGAADDAAGDQTKSSAQDGDGIAIKAGEIQTGIRFGCGGWSDRCTDAKANAGSDADAGDGGKRVAGEFNGSNFRAGEGVLRAAGMFSGAHQGCVVGGCEEAGSAFLVR